MEVNQLKAIVLGAGNLAYHLTSQLHLKGIKILQVYNRDLKKANEIAREVNAIPVTNIDELHQNADLYLFMVSDDAIVEILKTGLFNKKNLVHFAGAVPIDIFDPYSGNQGVIYPLQTFSRDKRIDYSNLPVFLESSNKKMAKLLEMITRPVFKKIYHANSKQRALLHLSAVFACNFSNFMLGISHELAGKDFFPLLRPLMEETINKGFSSSPLESQTGPARRNDVGTMDVHREMLNDYPEYQKIYTFMSKKISGYYLKKERETDE